MKYIDLKCPALINFYCNIENGNIITVNDYVDLCDLVELSISMRYEVSKAYINNVLLLGDNVVLKAIKAFFAYTNLPINGVIVKIKKQIPEQVDLKGLDNIAAGVILALNTYYRLDLSNEDLIQIGLLVNKKIPLFIYGGYQQVCNYIENMCRLEENRCEEYLIVLGRLKDNWADTLDYSNLLVNDINYTGQFYNCLENMAPSELLYIKERLLRLKADKVCINGTSNSVVASFSDRHNRFFAREELKREKIKTLICKPVDGIKVSCRYK